jgi:hypothetical protein
VVVVWAEVVDGEVETLGAVDGDVDRSSPEVHPTVASTTERISKPRRTREA